jgi:hypothetical protein
VGACSGGLYSVCIELTAGAGIEVSKSLVSAEAKAVIVTVF